MTAPVLALVLAISPAPHARYTVSVHGAPRRHVTLRAAGVPGGWVASFCNDRLCSPFSYDMNLDARGLGRIELQAVRTGDTAPHRIRFFVESTGAKPVGVSVIR